MPRNAVIAAAGLAAAVVGVMLLPPQRTARASPSTRTSMGGAFHIHTNRSDGSGSVEEVAAAAASAGLQFVIFTDHGNGTRPPDAPAYRASVLCIDGVEISTSGGHYAVVGMPRAPYPLAGEPRDVVEDVHRLGGLGFVAHGDSPKPDLRWTDWDAPFDGVEWLNLDTAWRAASAPALARAMVTYWFRGPETLAMLADGSNALYERVSALNRTRPVLAIAGLDAHGLIAPSYEASFRAISTRVDLPAPPTGDAAIDAAAVIDALRRGRHATVIDGVAPARVIPSPLSDPPAAPSSAPHLAAIRASLPVTSGWQVEHDSTSNGRITPGGAHALSFSYQLGSGQPVAQFAALVHAVTNEIATFDRVRFRARADRPMRVSLQLRAAGASNPPRWRRSIYLDDTLRDVEVRFSDVRPVLGLNATDGGPLPAASIGALMLIVDTNNTLPGSAGVISFENLVYVR